MLRVTLIDMQYVNMLRIAHGMMPHVDTIIVTSRLPVLPT